MFLILITTLFKGSKSKLTTTEWKIWSKFEFSLPDNYKETCFDQKSNSCGVAA